MRTVKVAASYQQEVLKDYEAEHRGYDGYDIGLEYLHEANTRCQGRWSLAVLSATDIASVILPSHNHPIEVIPRFGLPVSAAVHRVRQLPKQQMLKCWERIISIKDRDFSQMHLALQLENGTLTHVDGVHRLLAYGLFDKNQDLLTYVARL